MSLKSFLKSLAGRCHAFCVLCLLSSLNDPCPEVVFSACHTSNLNNSEQEETHHRLASANTDEKRQLFQSFFLNSVWKPLCNTTSFLTDMNAIVQYLYTRKVTLYIPYLTIVSLRTTVINLEDHLEARYDTLHFKAAILSISVFNFEKSCNTPHSKYSWFNYFAFIIWEWAVKYISPARTISASINSINRTERYKSHASLHSN